MLGLPQWPGAYLSRWFEGWLSRRLPRRREHRLDQRRIFILPTREGIGFVLLVLAIFVAGINYANNLMLGIAFLLVSLFLLSILHTYRNLSGLKIIAGRSEDAFVGEDAVFHITLESAAGFEHEAIRLQWGAGAAELVDLIDAPERQLRMLLPVRRRGRFQPPRLRVETRFPLGLLNAWSWVDLEASCLVYPRPLESQFPRESASRGEEGDQVVHEGSDDFDGLKRYGAGDSPRHIAWKQYARTGELYTKVFVGHQSQQCWLDWQSVEGDLELRLSRLCYWVVSLSRQDRYFGLRLPGREINLGRGEAHRLRCLEALALYGTDAQGAADG